MVAVMRPTTLLTHDRGPPLVFVAGEQEHGGAYVFVDNLGAICDDVVLSQKMMSGWTEIFEPIGLALGTNHWTLHRYGCRISGNIVHVSHLLPPHSVPLPRKRSNLEGSAC